MIVRLGIARGAMAAGLGGALVILTAGGCRNVIMERALDDARAERLSLQNEVRDLERRNRELERALQARRRSEGDHHAVDLPRIIEIDVGRYSRITLREPGQAFVQLWIHPRDGRGRFLQMAGEMTVHIAHVPADGEAQTLLQVQLTHEEVRDGYRSFLTGTHYAFEFPMMEFPVEVASGVVTIEYVDAWTGGSVLRASGVLPVDSAHVPNFSENPHRAR